MEASPSTFAAHAGGFRQILRRKIIGGRVYQVAGEEDAVADKGDGGDVHAIGSDEPCRAFARLAVALEPVAAERERKHGQRRIVGAAGKPVGALRQRSGELAEQKRPAIGRIRAAQPEQDATDIPLRVGQQHMSAGLCLEVLRDSKTPLVLLQVRQEGAELLRLDEVDGNCCGGPLLRHRQGLRHKARPLAYARPH